MRRFRSLIVAAGATAMLAAGGGIAAWASWSTGSNSAAATARSGRIPVIGPPQVELSGDTLTIAWSPVQLAPGEPVDSYVVLRIDGSSAEVACTAAASAQSCDDDDAPAGRTVTYVVHATRGAHWVGENSEPSEEVLIPGLATVSALADEPSADAPEPPDATKEAEPSGDSPHTSPQTSPQTSPEASPTPSATASSSEPTPSATPAEPASPTSADPDPGDTAQN